MKDGLAWCKSQNVGTQSKHDELRERPGHVTARLRITFYANGAEQWRNAISIFFICSGLSFCMQSSV